MLLSGPAGIILSFKYRKTWHPRRVRSVGQMHCNDHDATHSSEDSCGVVKATKTAIPSTMAPASVKQPLLALSSSSSSAVPVKPTRPVSGKAALRKEASYVFKYLVVAQITVYLEAGSIPCLLDSFAVAFNMSSKQQGLLGSVVYVALCVASPLCGLCLKHYDAKTVLGISLVLNILFILCFAMTPTGLPYSADLLIFARGLIGFTQAFLCVYTPLWIDTFSPRKCVAGWMSYLQGSVPLGVMFGYLFGSMSNWVHADSCGFACWRWPFLLQFLLVLPLMVGIFMLPTEHICIKAFQAATTTKKTTATTQHANVVTSKKELPPLVSASSSSSIPASSSSTSLSSATSSSHNHSMLQPPPSSSSPSQMYPPPTAPSSSSTSATSLRYSFNGELNLHHNHLNAAQKSAIRASYVTPRFRMDSYDIDLNHLEQWEYALAEITNEAYSPEELTDEDHSDRNNMNNHLHGDVPHYGSSRVNSHSSYSMHHHHAQREDEEDEINGMNETHPLQSRSTSKSSLRNSAHHHHHHHHQNKNQSSRGSLSQHEFLDTMSIVVDLDQPRWITNRLDSSSHECMHPHYPHHAVNYDELSMLQQCCILLARPIYTLIVIGLSAIYFVVTGVQFWCTIYLQKNFQTSVVILNGLFVLVAGTGPILGVFFGGALIDRAGDDFHTYMHIYVCVW
jgi:MFS family permease